MKLEMENRLGLLILFFAFCKSFPISKWNHQQEKNSLERNEGLIPVMDTLKKELFNRQKDLLNGKNSRRFFIWPFVWYSTWQQDYSGYRPGYRPGYPSYYYEPSGFWWEPTPPPLQVVIDARSPMTTMKPLTMPTMRPLTMPTSRPSITTPFYPTTPIHPSVPEHPSRENSMDQNLPVSSKPPGKPEDTPWDQRWEYKLTGGNSNVSWSQSQNVPTNSEGSNSWQGNLEQWSNPWEPENSHIYNEESYPYSPMSKPGNHPWNLEMNFDYSMSSPNVDWEAYPNADINKPLKPTQANWQFLPTHRNDHFKPTNSHWNFQQTASSSRSQQTNFEDSVKNVYMDKSLGIPQIRSYSTKNPIGQRMMNTSRYWILKSNSAKDLNSKKILTRVMFDDPINDTSSIWTKNWVYNPSSNTWNFIPTTQHWNYYPTTQRWNYNPGTTVPPWNYNQISDSSSWILTTKPPWAYNPVNTLDNNWNFYPTANPTWYTSGSTGRWNAHPTTMPAWMYNPTTVSSWNYVTTAPSWSYNLITTTTTPPTTSSYWDHNPSANWNVNPNPQNVNPTWFNPTTQQWNNGYHQFQPTTTNGNWIFNPTPTPSWISFNPSTTADRNNNNNWYGGSSGSWSPSTNNRNSSQGLFFGQPSNDWINSPYRKNNNNDKS